MRPEVKRLLMIAFPVGLVLILASATAHSEQDKVFLTFMAHPKVHQPVDYAVRALCGNTATNVKFELVSLTPMSGETSSRMNRLGEWCYGQASVAFERPGRTAIKANVTVVNPWGTLVLQDEIELMVYP